MDPANATMTWATSVERTSYLQSGLRRSTHRAWFGICLAIVSAAWLEIAADRSGYSVLGITGLVVSGGVVIWSMAPYRNARRAYFERVQAEKGKAVEEALKHLEGHDAKDILPLTALFIFNRRQLDEYQTLTKRHADESFRNAQVAAGLGFAALLLGALLVIQQKGSSSSVQYAIGGLSSLGALLSTYLSRTFFRSHKDAMIQLAIYYEEPFLTSRALSAERVISRIPALNVPPTDTNISLLVQRLLNPTASLAPNGRNQIAQRSLDSDRSALLGIADSEKSDQSASRDEADGKKAGKRWWQLRRRQTTQ